MNKWKFTEQMQAAGFTQLSFAQELGMSKNTLNNKLNGRGYFTTREIKEICTCLHIADPQLVVDIFLNELS